MLDSITEEEYINEIGKKANNYEQTVIALLSFANHARWDNRLQNHIPRSNFSFGRRMDSEKGETVTPDLIVQRRENYGLITEAKKDFPKNKEYWKDNIEQLKSYDGKLKGWFTEDQFIKISDIVLLTYHTRGPAVSKFIEERYKEGELLFKNKFSIITFVIAEEYGSFIHLRKEFGEISDKYLNNSLENVCPISMEKIISDKGGMKFYDSEPPMPYLLQILWDSVFSDMKEDYEYNEKKKCTPIILNLKELTHRLQKFYGVESKGERDPEIPKSRWVKKALEILVKAKHAEVSDKDTDEYIILYKSKRGDNLANFSKIYYRIKKKRAKKKRKDKKQLELPI